jgi:hypothetical protein
MMHSVVCRSEAAGSLHHSDRSNAVDMPAGEYPIFALLPIRSLVSPAAAIKTAQSAKSSPDGKIACRFLSADADQ